ncbi:hypothetical protein [Clostridium tyrobutyricum]|uniref:hypothetical protein n=1 Tax=Clostridium tyrobutyricum TaxID=1519 RepID=UPI001C385332|nr:hypothetical protein [Clostridium tyrobutyricum]MBV4427100.1 hypothetical protein [Clostridium tyrobutyricum]MBV4442173.1 hypothetical protein [Clostridium tyrobutyricum]MBV4442256.1 hypothetical protein [Clostridium tyrobutyricum]
MNDVDTKYGKLKGISRAEFYENGAIKECTLNDINELKTAYGILTPQYKEDGLRSKHIGSLSFYDNGSLKSIYLQNPTEIKSPIGLIQAEFITFYEDGNIKRIFPLNGKITAYWTEEDEYKLSKEIEISLSIGYLKRKVVAVHFYKNGSVNSITFWRKDKIKINSPLGQVIARIGISFYPDGKLKSFEPGNPVDANTEIGIIKAYNTQVIGIHGDSNSLEFSKCGKVKALITCTDRIEAVNKISGEKQMYRPLLRKSIVNENAMEVIPLNIEFQDNKVIFSNGMMHKFQNEFNIDEFNFNISNLNLNLKSPCSSCSECSDCND